MYSTFISEVLVKLAGCRQSPEVQKLKGIFKKLEQLEKTGNSSRISKLNFFKDIGPIMDRALKVTSKL